MVFWQQLKKESSTCQTSFRSIPHAMERAFFFIGVEAIQTSRKRGKKKRKGRKERKGKKEKKKKKKREERIS